MGLMEKIEEIRKKPDHVKIRYVWLFVLLCLPIIILIWFFSIKTDLNESFGKKNNQNQVTSDIKKSGADLLKEIEKQKDSMQNAQTDLQSETKSNQNQ